MAEQIITKRCPRCKQVKFTSEFHKCRREKDGCQCYCKICESEIKNRKSYRESSLRYKNSEKGKAAEKKYSRKSSKTNQRKARSAVNMAVFYGKLSSARSYHCRYCWNQAEQYHHHLGYATEHWFDVEPICIKCHNFIHQ
jgi:hypothetical protein